MRPRQLLSDLMQVVKSRSSLLENEVDFDEKYIFSDRSSVFLSR